MSENDGKLCPNDPNDGNAGGRTEVTLLSWMATLMKVKVWQMIAGFSRHCNLRQRLLYHPHDLDSWRHSGKDVAGRCVSCKYWCSMFRKSWEHLQRWHCGTVLSLLSCSVKAVLLCRLGVLSGESVDLMFCFYYQISSHVWASACACKFVRESINLLHVQKSQDTYPIVEIIMAIWTIEIESS